MASKYQTHFIDFHSNQPLEQPIPSDHPIPYDVGDQFVHAPGRVSQISSRLSSYRTFSHRHDFHHGSLPRPSWR